MGKVFLQPLSSLMSEGDSQLARVSSRNNVIQLILFSSSLFFAGKTPVSPLQLFPNKHGAASFKVSLFSQVFQFRPAVNQFSGKPRTHPGEGHGHQPGDARGRKNKVHEIEFASAKFLLIEAKLNFALLVAPRRKPVCNISKSRANSALIVAKKNNNNHKKKKSEVKLTAINQFGQDWG